MKKVFFVCSLLCFGVVLSAEEMQFVTTLSQPTGSFARVESVNADSPARALQVNFCNSRISSGVVSVSGAVRAAYLKLDNSGSLGGNVPVYQLSTLNLGSGRSFEGGNVWAQEANPAAVKADGTLYGTDMKYLVAELPALEITDTANIKRGGPTGEDLEWGAQYACDYKEASGSISCTGNATYASYVLKSKGGDMREPTATCEDPDYKVNHKSECCASAPETDTDCYYESTSYAWESSGSFDMAAAFGSDWLVRSCQEKCWYQGGNTSCGSGASGVSESLFTTSAIIMKTSDNCSNHSCSGTICDKDWYQSYTCDSDHKNVKFVHLCGYNNMPFTTYCPPKGSGESPRFSGSSMSWTCKETKKVNKNGW